MQDVPGVAYGTIPNRADGTLLKIIPKSEQPGNRDHTVPHSKRAMLKRTAAAAPVVPLRSAFHASLLRRAGIKQKAFQQTEMLASKGMNLAKGVKVDVPIELAKNTGG